MRTDEVRALLRTERRHIELTRDALGLHAGPLGGTRREDTGELSGMDEHVADVASDTLEREIDLSLFHAVEADLAAVDAALARVADGSYGRCETCRIQIGDARLRALPAATRCLAHQAEAEVADAWLRRSLLADETDLEAAAHLDLLPPEEGTPTTQPAEEAAVHRVS